MADAKDKDDKLPFSVTSVGDILQRIAVVGDEMLIKALMEQRRRQSEGQESRLGEILVEMGVIAAVDVDVALALQEGLRGDEAPKAMLVMLRKQLDISRQLLTRVKALEGDPEAAGD
jgi:hypothetical protein